MNKSPLLKIFNTNADVEVACLALSHLEIPMRYVDKVISCLSNLNNYHGTVRLITCRILGKLYASSDVASDLVIAGLLNAFNDRNESITETSVNILKNLKMSEQARCDFLLLLISLNSVFFDSCRMRSKLFIAHLLKLSTENRMELLAKIKNSSADVNVLSITDFAERLVDELNKQSFIVNTFLNEKTLPEIAQQVDQHMRIGS